MLKDRLRSKRLWDRIVDAEEAARLWILSARLTGIDAFAAA